MTLGVGGANGTGRGQRGMGHRFGADLALMLRRAGLAKLVRQEVAVDE